MLRFVPAITPVIPVYTWVSKKTAATASVVRFGRENVVHGKSEGIEGRPCRRIRGRGQAFAAAGVGAR